MTQIVSGTQVAQTQPANTQAPVLVENPDSRPWYLSKGVMGGFASLLAWLLMMFGIDVAQADVESITLAGITIAGAVASIVSVIGRLTAKRPVG